MITRLLGVNHAILFLCVSMYLGTGWSMVLFSFPVAPQLTVDTYYLQFVPQVAAATTFFTYMTSLMIAVNLVMIWSEWKTPMRWVPILVMLLVIAATVLTVWKIFPLNKEMSDRITDASRLQAVLQEWMMLNKVRVGLWTLQWLALMWYFIDCFIRATTAKPGAPA
jgi:hypothetical protein